MEDQDPYISVKKAARMLGISTATIRQWCEKGIVKCLRLPTRVRRIKKSEIDKIINKDWTSKLDENANKNEEKKDGAV